MTEVITQTQAAPSAPYLPGDVTVATSEHFEIVRGDDGEHAIYFRHSGSPLSCGIGSEDEARRLVGDLEDEWQAEP